MAQQHREHHSDRTERDAEVDEEPTATAEAKGDELLDAMDVLLDEIDGILEENAQEFVATYVQRGGE